MTYRYNKEKKIVAWIAVLLLVAGIVGFIKWFAGHAPIPRQFPKHYTKFDNYGVPVPEGYIIHGIDISRYQGDVKWSWLKEVNYDGMKIDFVIIKATESIGHIDKKFSSNFKALAQHNIRRGAYHFFDPAKSGAEQATHFITQVNLQPYDLRPVLDVEVIGRLSKAQLQKEVRAYVKLIEKVYGCKPIIYANAHFYNKYLAGAFDEYPLWVAHYRNTRKPRLSRNWHIWQYADHAQVSGIIGPVDVNVFKGDSAAFHKLTIAGAR